AAEKPVEKRVRLPPRQASHRRERISVRLRPRRVHHPLRPRRRGRLLPPRTRHQTSPSSTRHPSHSRRNTRSASCSAANSVIRPASQRSALLSVPREERGESAWRVVRPSSGGPPPVAAT